MITLPRGSYYWFEHNEVQFVVGFLGGGEYFVRERRRIKSYFYEISLKIICVEGYESEEYKYVTRA